MQVSKQRETNKAGEDDARNESQVGLDSAQRHSALRNHRIRFNDAIDPNAEQVKEANKNDVIFGRGKANQNHPGNVRMRTIIEKHKDHYKSLRRSKKRDLVEAVYLEIAEGGTRFLNKPPDKDAFVVVDLPVALQKVSNTLRCKKRDGSKISALHTSAIHLNVGERVSSQNSVAAALGDSGMSNMQGLLPLTHSLGIPSPLAFVGTSTLGGSTPNISIAHAPASTQFLHPTNSVNLAALNHLQSFQPMASLPLGNPFVRPPPVPTTPAFPPSLGTYHNQVREQVLLRENLMLQQFGGANGLDTVTMTYKTLNSDIPDRELESKQPAYPGGSGSNS
jgi:hypothetical protein